MPVRILNALMAVITAVLFCAGSAPAAPVTEAGYLHEQASALNAEGKYEEAIQRYEKALSLLEASKEKEAKKLARHYLAELLEAYKHTFQYGKGIALLRTRLANSTGEEAELLRIRLAAFIGSFGDDLVRSNMAEKALAIHQKAAELDPERVQYLCDMAIDLVMLNRRDEARRFIESVSQNFTTKKDKEEIAETLAAIADSNFRVNPLWETISPQEFERSMREFIGNVSRVQDRAEESVK